MIIDFALEPGIRESSILEIGMVSFIGAGCWTGTMTGFKCGWAFEFSCHAVTSWGVRGRAVVREV